MQANSNFMQLLAVLLLGRAETQLQVQIRRYERTPWDSELKNYTVVADYSFPKGFSTEWFVSSYANIPAEGITGLLYHPLPPDGCSTFASCSDCEMWRSNLNLSKISLLEDYHLCTEQKIRSNQEASFNAMITYSPGDKCRGVGGRVHDRSTGRTVDVKSSGVPLAVVSEAFYNKLLQTAAIRNCTPQNLALVSLRVGSTNVSSVRSALTAFLVMICLLIIVAHLLCCFFVYLICDKCFRKRRGRYNIHERHTRELGVLQNPRNVPRGVHILPYVPEEREFHCGVEGSNTQCSICLEEFLEGEVITAVACDKNHAFHPSCINKWLDSKSTCPVCRTSTYS